MSVAAINGSPLNQQTAQQCKQQQKCLQNSLPSSNNNNSNSIRLEPLKLTILCIWFACAVISNWVVLAFVHDLVSWSVNINIYNISGLFIQNFLNILNSFF
jgi:hypothetical protein